MKEITIQYRPHQFQREMNAKRKMRNVYVCHRRMGKTLNSVNVLIRYAVTTKHTDWRGAYIAPLKTQAKDIAWDYFKEYVSPVPGIKINETELRIDFPNGSRIKLYGADNPDQLRGLRFDGVVMDEVGDMNPDVWESVVSKCLRNPHNKERHGWCDFIGTPKGMNYFFDLYQKAIARDDWGDGFYPVTVTNLLTEEELAQEREESGTEEKFKREFLCDFGASVEDVLIPLTLAQPAIGKHVNEQDYRFAPKIIGIDVGGENDSHVIARRQGLAPLPLIAFMEPDHMTAAARMSNYIHEYRPDYIFVDQGHGVGIISRLRQLGHKIIEVPFGSSADDVEHFVNKRAEMYARCKEYLREGGALPDDKILLADLTTPIVVPTSTGKIQLERKDRVKLRIGRSPDRGDAFVLTFAYQVTQRTEEPVYKFLMKRKREYDPLSRYRTNGIRMT